MKKILTGLLLVCMLLCLCACGQEGNTPETTAPVVETTTVPVENVTEDDGMAIYTAKIVDEGGNPVAGAMVQICKDDCFPGVTDSDGVATFNRPEAEGYKISFISLPAGYEYADETTEFYYEGDAKDMTITLKAVV